MESTTSRSCLTGHAKSVGNSLLFVHNDYVYSARERSELLGFSLDHNRPKLPAGMQTFLAGWTLAPRSSLPVVDCTDCATDYALS